jgi:co-chaperonin GroES (HSP10)
MINKDFIAETNKLIEKIKERGIKLENGNVLVAKVKTDRVTSGGILLADDHAEREDYKSGFARIIALPPMVEGDADLKIGQYVMHSHEARYKPYTPALREVLDTYVDDNFVYSVQDSEVILTVPEEKFN